MKESLKRRIHSHLQRGRHGSQDSKENIKEIMAVANQRQVFFYSLFGTTVHIK